MYKFLTCFFLLIATSNLNAQYYYKDIIGTKQINNNYHLAKTAKVNKVTLKSFVGNNEVTEGFDCNQQFTAAQNKVTTYTKTTDAGETFFIAYYNQNDQIIKSTDSSGMVVSETIYTYDSENRLTTVVNSSRATSITNIETHNWKYDAKGNPTSMQKIRNASDTTWVTFVHDEKGNISEEHVKRNVNIPQPIVFYYYDNKNRLTDVVRYNQKAKRLLPDYIFEYDENNRISVMTVIPEGSNDYQKWYYKYDEEGLKDADFCYNKRNELQGKILYEYKYN